MSNVTQLTATERTRLRQLVNEARRARENSRDFPRCVGCGRDLREDGVTDGCKSCWDRARAKRRYKNKAYVPKAVGVRAVCVTCSAEFEAKAPHQKHCSTRCNKRHSWRVRRQRLRSDPVAEAEFLRQQRERVRKCQRPHVVVVVATCRECGVEFRPRINTSQAAFCCPEHKWVWHSRMKREAA